MLWVYMFFGIIVCIGITKFIYLDENQEEMKDSVIYFILIPLLTMIIQSW